MAAYVTTLRMTGFQGLYQDGDGIGVDPRYALEAVNVETRGGVLAAAARGACLKGALDAPIGTLMRLSRRFYADGEHPEILIAASGGQLYWMPPGGDAWTRLAPPEGTDAYLSDGFSWVAYEINPEGSQDPVDVLLLSNERDGMLCLRGDTLEVSRVHTPRKFGVIARHAERIWGGAIAGDPDTLLYSAPFDPFDWAQNNDIPEDGAGEVKQPSWDGDSFEALTPFGAQLIAMKKRRVWRILGTDPGQYIFREQYGGGALAERTVAVDGERILMLGPDGLLRYDGLSVSPFAQPFARAVFARMNRAALHGACACLHRHAYCCALPLDGALHNNAVLVHDTRENTWLLREGMTVRAFLPTEDALFYTSATEPGRVFRWGEDAAKEGAAVPARWVGPWQDLGDKNLTKGGFAVHLAPRAKASAELLVTLRTERGARTKAVRAGPEAKQRRLTFGLRGKRFRLEIEGQGGGCWDIPGGVQVDVETDLL